MSLNDGRRWPGLGEGFGGRLVSRGWCWQRGQTLAIVALMLVVLVGFLAIVIDVGNIYVQRRFMQNAADAGALAGARAMALHGTGAVEAAVDKYAEELNGAQQADYEITSPRTVLVTATKTFRTFFAGVVGVPEFTVFASAEAEFGPATTVRERLVPLAVEQHGLYYGGDLNAGVMFDEMLRIWDTDATAEELALGYNIPNSQRGWLNLDGAEPGGQAVNADEISIIIEGGGYDAEVTAPLWINGSPHSMKKCLRTIDNELQKAGGALTVTLPVYADLRSARDRPEGVDLGNGQQD